MTTAEILRTGKARLIERGWCQSDEKAIFGPDDGPCCAATAMPTEGLDFGRQLEVAKLFREANDITSGIGDWNDAPERTLDEVLAAYDKAIAAAEASQMKTTAADLRAMPMPKAVVAFLRACRTFDDVGDIDGPWFDEAKPFLVAAAGVTDWRAYMAWEADHSQDEVFAVFDKAIAAADETAGITPR